MQNFEDTIYHIYAKDRCLYHSLRKEDFEEKWELLHVMVDLISTEYDKDDLTYVKLQGKVGYGGPGKFLPTVDDEHSY
jgi:hypothetical protein